MYIRNVLHVCAEAVNMDKLLNNIILAQPTALSNVCERSGTPRPPDRVYTAMLVEGECLNTTILRKVRAISYTMQSGCMPSVLYCHP